MLDLTEDLLTMTQAAGRLPGRRAGKKPHVSTLYRWASRGVGGVVLETVQIGGTRYTSAEALQRFVDRLSDPCPSSVRPVRTSRARDVRAAERTLDAHGVR